MFLSLLVIWRFGDERFSSKSMCARHTNEISSLLWFLKTCKHHLCAWNVLLRVQKVVVKGPFRPDDSLFLVGLAIGVALGITTCSAKETSKVGALY